MLHTMLHLAKGTTAFRLIITLAAGMFLHLQAQGQILIDFENNSNWNAGSGGIGSYQTNHSYTDGVFSATGGPALREGLTNSIGNYAWRLKDESSNSPWTINISSGGVASFSMQIRRWAYNPAPNYTIEYSVDGGSTWTFVATVNNTTLNNSDAYKTFSGTINSSNNDIKIRVVSAGGERIIIDNFSWIPDANCTTPTEQPSNFSATAVTSTGFGLGWANADDTHTLILAKPGAPVTTGPSDNTAYAAGEIIDGATVIYSGDGESTTLTGLVPGTVYYLQAYAYCPGGYLYNTTTPLQGKVLTQPENPNLSIGCISESSAELSWTNPTSEFDGYIVVGRENENPTTIDAQDPDLLTPNSDFSQAPQYSTVNKFLYKGSGNSVTITGLEANSNYTFKIFSYSLCSDCLNTSDWEYSAGTQSSAVAATPAVTNLTATPGAVNAVLGWAIPSPCVEEVIVVASDQGPVTGSPSGSGYTVNSSAYTDPANPVFDGNPQQRVVYSGTGLSVDVTGLITDSTYCFSVFTRIGTYWSAGEDICTTAATFTVFQPGDLAIVAVNTSVDDPVYVDEFCFTTFVTILPGTAIDFTDNGYEREYSGYWATTEGVIRMTLDNSASPIPAGSVIYVKVKSNAYLPGHFKAVYNGAETNDWSFISLNENRYFSPTSQESIYLLQDGAWSFLGNYTSQKGMYSGTVITGWTNDGWKTSLGPGNPATAWSTQYPGTECFSIDVSGLTQSSRVKYTGSFDAAPKNQWLGRIGNSDNWSGYASNTNYYSGFPLYSSASVVFPVIYEAISPGVWTGAMDNEWFNCRNWSALAYPNENTKTTIPGEPSNQPIIDNAVAATADLHLGATSKLTLTNGARLNIYADLVNNSTHAPGGTFAFVGGLSQSVLLNEALTLQNVVVDKTSDKVIVDGEMTVNGTLELISGVVEIPDTSQYFHMGPASSVAAVSNAGFIDGWVEKKGSTDFTFPIGDFTDSGNVYQPLTVFDFTGPTDFRARYVSDPHPDAGPYWDGQGNADNDLEELGHCDYWSLRSTGTIQPKITLHYLGYTCNQVDPVDGPSIIGMARWNGLDWDYPFPDGMDASTYGEISTNTLQYLGDFVLTSDDPELVILPIELLDFRAVGHNDFVKLFWATASETNNDYFTIERSSDGRLFEEILRQEGAGNSNMELHYYQRDEHPLPGTSYYRLRQTDFDGSSAVSDAVAVYRKAGGLEITRLYPSHDGLQLEFLAEPGPLFVEIYDAPGKLLYRKAIAYGGGAASLSPPLMKGVYVLRLSQNQQVAVQKFVY